MVADAIEHISHKKAFNLQTVSSFRLDESMDICILLVLLLTAFAMLGVELRAKQTITILARGNKENAKRRYCCSTLPIHSLLLFSGRRLSADTVSQLCFVFWFSGTAETVIPLTRSQANVVLKIACRRVFNKALIQYSTSKYDHGKADLMCDRMHKSETSEDAA